MGMHYALAGMLVLNLAATLYLVHLVRYMTRLYFGITPRREPLSL